MTVQLNKSVFSPYIFKYIYIYIFLTKNLIKVSFKKQWILCFSKTILAFFVVYPEHLRTLLHFQSYHIFACVFTKKFVSAFLSF